MKYFEYGLLEAQGLKTSVRPPPHVFAIADAAYRAIIEVSITMIGNLIGNAALFVLPTGHHVLSWLAAQPLWSSVAARKGPYRGIPR
eukprot:47240-Eustigmatos_ZCMA.PRE.1